MKSSRSEIARFLAAGALNTGLGFVIYALLLTVLPYPVAYTATYVLGIVFSYHLNRRFVFGVPGTVRTFLQFPLTYVIQYVLGLALMYLLVSVLRVNALVAPLVTVVATVPVSYLMSRSIFRRGRPRAIGPPVEAGRGGAAPARPSRT